MEKITFPAACAPLAESELRAVEGGGEFKDALRVFLNNLHVEDYTRQGSFVAVSFTFVPKLLFNVIKDGFLLAVRVEDKFVSRRRF